MNKVVLVLVALSVISGVGVLGSNVFEIELQKYKIFNSFSEFDNPTCSCLGDDGTFSQENCQAFSNGFSDPNNLCTSVAEPGEYGDPVKILSAQGCGVGFWKNNLDSGLASIQSENTLVWPEGYQPDYYFNDMFHTTINLPQNDLDVEIAKVAKNQNDKKDNVIDIDDDVKLAKVDNNQNDKKDNVIDIDDDGSVVESDIEDVKDNDDDGIDAAQVDSAKDNGPTLQEALNSKGGDMNSLLRQSVTAMLNAAHPDINYPYSVIQVIELTQISIINEDYKDTKELFEKSNEKAEKPSMCLE